MKKNHSTARVVIRRIEQKIEDLEKIATDPSMTMLGRLISRKVFEGKGVATIDLNTLSLAINDECGHNQLLDHFNIASRIYRSPLLYELISEKLDAKKKTDKTLTATATIRRREEMEMLADYGNSMFNHCGSVGRAIAVRVLEGNGNATVELDLIRIAIDTDSGHNNLLDYYNLIDSRTLRPLLHQLIEEKLEAHRGLMN